MSRPTVTVYSGTDGKVAGQVKLPGVFECPIRTDVVIHVHRDISKNGRQPYAVSKYAGHQTSAESWGTGRAVSRIPRVPGGGTHRAGQGAFGNMCRGGRMFSPTKVYRRWHRKVNKNQRRFALTSALAASANASLVLARGHRIEAVPEIPLVVSTATLKDLAKTSSAIKVLKTLRAYDDVVKAKDSRKIRAGKGKMRNRRYRQRRGPLIVFHQRSNMNFAFRNLPGVEFCNVNSLNLLKLAPGGHLGRFVIWTQEAFERLNALYGTYKKASVEKFGYRLPRPVVTNSDLHRLINSSEVQSVLNKVKHYRKYVPHKKNPLKNLGVMLKLNPYAKTLKRKELLRSNQRAKKIARNFLVVRKARTEEQKQLIAIKAARKEGKKGKDLPKFTRVKRAAPKPATKYPRRAGQKPKKNNKKNPGLKMNKHKKASLVLLHRQ